jgi:hypothetical protein
VGCGLDSGVKAACGRGMLVNFRTVLALGVCVGLSACANDKPASALFAATESVGLPSVVSSANAATPDMPPKKTMSDRILAAIALERVTGLKPDPARLMH